MSATLSRRLATVEGKILTRVSPVEQRLLETPAFIEVLDSHGVAVEDFQRNGLGALPRDLLRALVERLKATVAED
jgi:hypothetical protein